MYLCHTHTTLIAPFSRVASSRYLMLFSKFSWYSYTHSAPLQRMVWCFKTSCSHYYAVNASPQSKPSIPSSRSGSPCDCVAVLAKGVFAEIDAVTKSTRNIPLMGHVHDDAPQMITVSTLLGKCKINFVGSFASPKMAKYGLLLLL